jgi:ABC-2 type transport system permease protein
MRLDGALVVAKKELREIAANRGTLISTAFLAFFFGVGNGVASSSNSTLDGLALYLGSFVGVMAGFLLCGSVFFREKQTGVIETLLCTPLDLRSIWLGKTMGVTLPSYLFALGSMVAVSFIYPGAAASLALVAILGGVVPLLIASSVGLVGFIQLALGMRENRILSFVVFIFLIAGLTSIGQLAITQDMVWTGTVVLLAISGALLGSSALLVNRLNKEKIVTTIPD